MNGFFEINNLQSDSIGKGKILSCISCGLYKKVKTPKMKPYGNFKKEVMIIGDTLSYIDDEDGKPWQDNDGVLLKNTLKKLKFDLFNDAISLNSCNCTPIDKPVTSYQIDCCRRMVQKAINKYKPKIIILLGIKAVESIIGKYWKNSLGEISRWRGMCIPDQNYKCWLLPTFSPNDVKKNTVSELIWGNDLKQALMYINKNTPVQPNFNDYIEFCFTSAQLHKAVKQIKIKGKKSVMCFDYETTGLRPYRKGHRIVCTSVALSPTKCFVFENNENNNKIFSTVLKSDIKKVAHNLQFEDMWSSHFISNVNNWKWCTMNTAHILDNRPNISGLKFQTYINFGVCSYDESVSPYLKGINPKKYGANSINKIDAFIKQYGMEQLFEYCGLDSIFTYMLYQKQKELV